MLAAATATLLTVSTTLPATFATLAVATAFHPLSSLPIVKNLFRLPAIVLTALLAQAIVVASCDDDSAGIGSTVMPTQDYVSTSQKTFTVSSRTIQSDSVLANTNDSYLGCILDPETRAKTTCNFLAQFNVLEDTSLPAKSRMFLDDEGNVIVDSVCVRVFINSYYGDSLTTMKLSVQELDTNKVVSENANYYTNLDAEAFLTEGKGIQTSLSYAVRDLSRPDSLIDNASYRSIIVHFPVAYGQQLVNKYYENPAYYSNSYQFIHHVCPGFYFKTTGGVGSMICAQTSTLDVYFRYHSTTATGGDTIIDGMQRMAATEEVIQQTTIENKIPASMLDEANDYTYVKSPAGLFTELTLPVAEIVSGEHYTDTINSASLVLSRVNSAAQSDYNLEAPANVLLLRKKAAYSFFEKNQLTNSVDSYIATFDETYNAYSFSNVSKLITLLRDERDSGAGVSTSDDEATRNAKYAAWEATIPIGTRWSSSPSMRNTRPRQTLTVSLRKNSSTSRTSLVCTA